MQFPVHFTECSIKKNTDLYRSNIEWVNTNYTTQNGMAVFQYQRGNVYIHECKCNNVMHNSIYRSLYTSLLHKTYGPTWHWRTGTYVSVATKLEFVIYKHFENSLLYYDTLYVTCKLLMCVSFGNVYHTGIYK